MSTVIPRRCHMSEGVQSRLKPLLQVRRMRRTGEQRSAYPRSAVMRAPWVRYRKLIRQGCPGGHVVAALAAICLAVVTSNAYAEYLNAHVPEGWVHTGDVGGNRIRISNYVAPDASASLVYESLRDDNPPSPETFVIDWLEGARSRCEELADYSVFTGNENNFPTAVHLARCKDDEVSLLKVIQASGHLFTVVWQSNHTDDEVLKTWMRIFREIRVLTDADAQN